jgi:predicted AlkP superfamily phosphohydrolase/phosphomutase
MKKKTVIIGIDGVPYGLMDNLSEKGVMPNFQRLKKTGIFKKMRSSIPPLSSISWSSIITGKNPAEHGIFGFMELIPESYALSFPNFNNLESPPFWLKGDDRKYVIINVPSTYPTKPLNGIHISGFISFDLEKAVYPTKYLKDLKDMDYKIDVDYRLVHQSKVLFFKKLMETLEARIKAYRYFWDKGDWDVFMFVFTGSDRLGHFFWDAYEEESHEHHKDFLNYFKRVDEVIGEMVGKLGQDDSFFIISDHGMQRMKINVNINYFLKEKGFLELNEEFKSYNQITENSKVFALDPARIYIHEKGKYPRGRIEKQQKQRVVEEVILAIKNLEFKGEKIIDKIYRKEEIYQGKFLERAPDLVLLPFPGFRLRGAIEKKTLFEKDIFTGEHTLEDAFLFLKSPQYKTLPGQITVEDFCQLLEKTL